MKDFVGIDECIIICKTEIEELGQGTCPFCVRIEAREYFKHERRDEFCQYLNIL